jgi:hypothetical protein
VENGEEGGLVEGGGIKQQQKQQQQQRLISARQNTAPQGVAFCDGTLDTANNKCIDSRRKQRGYDCRDCMRCHDACLFFLTNASLNYRFDRTQARVGWRFARV